MGIQKAVTDHVEALIAILLEVRPCIVGDAPYARIRIGPLGMELDSVFNSVVLPQPVPPLMTMFNRALMAASMSIAISGVNAL